MPSYHFFTVWTLEASPEEVYQILEQPEDLPRWWGSVYLSVRIAHPGRPGGLGKVAELHTKGWLPYTLKWAFEVTQTDYPYGFSLQARGDFLGTGIWRFTRMSGGRCEVSYDWQIEAQKPLIRRLTWLLRPVFAWNHRWAMRQGEQGLAAELLRRRTPSGVSSPETPFPADQAPALP